MMYSVHPLAIDFVSSLLQVKMSYQCLSMLFTTRMPKSSWSLIHKSASDNAPSCFLHSLTRLHRYKMQSQQMYQGRSSCYSPAR